MIFYGEGSYSTGAIEIFYSDMGDVTIGKYCSIGKDVKVYLGGNHRTEWISTYPFHEKLKTPKVEGHPTTKGDVIIKNDVWIGNEAVIMSGVTIGNGACIGAYAVVAKDVPAYAVYAGNPAKLIRYRFTPEEIDKLEELAWWDWPQEKIVLAAALLQSGDMEGLYAFDNYSDI